MRRLATVFSWIGGIMVPLIALAFLVKASGENAAEAKTVTHGCATREILELETPLGGWWGAWLVLLLLEFGILIWRQYSVNHGKKIACGICTLIFAGGVGGILTLCIPEDELDYPFLR